MDRRYTGRRSVRLISRIAIGAALTCAIVSVLIPFASLIATTFKWPREETRSALLDWMPLRLPYRVVRTPYVASTDTRDYVRPPRMSEETWSELKPLIEPVLWDGTQPILAGRDVPDALRNKLREHVTRHIWQRIVDDMPPELWEQPLNRIRAAMDGATDRRRVEAAWRQLYRGFRIALPIVEMTDRIEHVAHDGSWWVSRGDVRLVSAPDEPFESVEVWADYSAGGATPWAAYLVSDVRLLTGASAVRSVTLRIRGDESYHRITPVVELGGRTYRTDESIVLDDFAWHDYRFAMPGGDIGGARSLREDTQSTRGGTSSDGRITLILTPRPYSGVVMSKLSHNYRDAWSRLGYPRSLWNTLVIALVGTVVQLATCVPAGYALARMRWPGRVAMYRLLIVTIAIPAQATMYPVMFIMRSIGMYDSSHSIWLRGAIGMGLFMWMATRGFARTPRDLELAATLDGCGPLRRFWNASLPPVAPIIVAIAVFQFIWTWADSLWARLLIADAERYTLGLELWSIQAGPTHPLGVAVAGVVLATLPVGLLLAATRRHLARALELIMTGLDVDRRSSVAKF